METRSAVKALWADLCGGSEVSFSRRVGREKVIVKCTIAPGRLPSGVDLWAFLAGKDPEVLCELAEEVRLLIETTHPKRTRRSAVFSTREAIAILGGRWPDEENITRIRRSILDRKAYPMPDDEPPPEKSFEAQGQTKKPGSHSESRHG